MPNRHAAAVHSAHSRSHSPSRSSANDHFHRNNSAAERNSSASNARFQRNSSASNAHLQRNSSASNAHLQRDSSASNAHLQRNQSAAENVQVALDDTLGYMSTETKGSRSSFSSTLSRLSDVKFRMDENALVDKGSFCGRLSEHPAFQFTVLGIIVANAVWIGMELQWEDSEVVAIYVEQFFCIMFSAELVVRFIGYKRKCDFFLDKNLRASNMFDTVLVSILVVDTYLLGLIWKDLVEMPAFSTMRLFRLLRIVRVLRFIPELAVMVKSMIAALRSVSMTFVLTMLIMYVFSVAFTMWARDHKQVSECSGIECIEVSFGSLPKSFITLMQVLCYDNTFMVVRAVGRESKLYAMVILLFLIIVAFTLLNILIGIICEIVASTKDAENSQRLKAAVEALFFELARKGDGRIQRSELEHGKVRVLIAECGVPPGTLSNATNLLPCDDDGCVELEDLEAMIFKLMKEPEVLDVLLAQKRLERVEADVARLALEASSSTSEACGRSAAEVNGGRPGGGARVRVEQAKTINARLEELESLLLPPRSHADGAADDVVDLDAAAAGAEDESSELGRAIADLGVSLEDLKSRLEASYVDFARPEDAMSASSLGASSTDVPGGSPFPSRPRELRHWHQASYEVIRCINSTNPLVAKLAKQVDTRAAAKATGTRAAINASATSPSGSCSFATRSISQHSDSPG